MNRTHERGLIAGAAALALFFTLLVGPALAAPDWNRTEDPLYEAIGLHAGKIGGVGLSLKFPFSWWLYGQATGGVWHTADNKRHNFGFMGQYILRQDTNIRLFVAAGLGYFYHKEKIEVLNGNPRYQAGDSWNTGFGVGVEWLRSDRFAIQVEGDFTHEGDDGTIMFFPQLGIYYYF